MALKDHQTIGGLNFSHISTTEKIISLNIIIMKLLGTEMIKIIEKLQ